MSRTAAKAPARCARRCAAIVLWIGFQAPPAWATLLIPANLHLNAPALEALVRAHYAADASACVAPLAAYAASAQRSERAPLAAPPLARHTVPHVRPGRREVRAVPSPQ